MMAMAARSKVRRVGRNRSLALRCLGRSCVARMLKQQELATVLCGGSADLDALRALRSLIPHVADCCAHRVALHFGSRVGPEQGIDSFGTEADYGEIVKTFSVTN